jgi:hypothetical protein
MLPPSSESKNKPSKKSAGSKQSLVSCLAYSLTLNIEVTCSSEMVVNFNGLHSIISQQIEVFITTGVRTSSPT